MKYFLLFAVLFIFCAFSFPFLPKASSSQPSKWEKIQDTGKYDLVFEGTPVKVASIKRGAVSDAIENIPDLKLLTANVYFSIDKIVKGRIPKAKVEPPSKMSQMQEAFKKKEYGKVLLSDYQTVPAEFERQRFRIAVTDPVSLFGFQFWDIPNPVSYRLYFKRYKTADTYVMLKSEKINPA